MNFVISVHLEKLFRLLQKNDFKQELGTTSLTAHLNNPSYTLKTTTLDRLKSIKQKISKQSIPVICLIRPLFSV